MVSAQSVFALACIICAVPARRLQNFLLREHLDRRPKIAGSEAILRNSPTNSKVPEEFSYAESAPLQAVASLLLAAPPAVSPASSGHPFHSVGSHRVASWHRYPPRGSAIRCSQAHTSSIHMHPESVKELQREVLEAYHGVLNSHNNTAGIDHPDVLSSKYNLAESFHCNGDLSGAEKLHKEVLDTRLRVLGSDHADTLKSKFALADTLGAQGNLDGAEKLQREVWNTRRRVLGSEHIDTLTSKIALADSLRARGNVKDAEKLQREVLEAKIRSLGPEHTETIKVKRNLELISQDLGNLHSADELQKHVLEDIQKQGGAVPECVTSPISPAIVEFNKAMVDAIKGVIDALYHDRDIPRFYILETIARVPYFAYLSCLHFYESLGMRGTTRRLRTHYAEADNELHHLLIMESLGGNDAFIDRFIAKHLALIYYWYNVGVYLWQPQAAYHLGELIEAHAFKTYNAFLEDHGDELRKRPVPEIARRYYGGHDAFESYLREEKDQRRPALNSLYDVFVQIRNDEGEHFRTLSNLVQYGDLVEPEGCPVVATE